ncbi:H-type lectin domain-containing protein [Falsihalocynthiibacter sp. SS001]|uniref:H-type lectin domain-containing protein n=1 Tax=Falsihalocynthiibacter sp. SS001 TaxID=3349698 RepID=UPI0036D36795
MRSIRNHLLGMDQGTLVMFSDFQEDGTMWTGTGKRSYRERVTFDGRFTDPPMVHISFSMWDFAHDTNQRGDISVENVTEDGFDAVFKTWGDTRIARLRVDWFAMGQVAHDDDWEL